LITNLGVIANLGVIMQKFAEMARDLPNPGS
jgi:hypothetical protein